MTHVFVFAADYVLVLRCGMDLMFFVLDRFRFVAGSGSGSGRFWH